MHIYHGFRPHADWLKMRRTVDMFTVRGSIIVLLLALLLGQRQAQSVEVLDNEKLSIRAEGWVQGGYSILSPAVDGRLAHRPYIGLARVVAEARHKRWGRVFLQVEALSETVVLIDAIAEVKPTDWLSLRLGKFKVPTSADYLIFGPFTPFVNRSYLVDDGFVPTRRLGAEAVYNQAIGPAAFSLQAGWFVPTGDERAVLPDGEGNILSLRTLLSFDFGLELHIAYADLLLADNRFEPDQIPDDFVWPRPVPLNSQLDAALIFRREGWTGYLEGVWAFDAPGKEIPSAFYLMVLKNIPLPYSELSLEPGLRYDLARRDEVTRQRVTAGLNLYIVGDFLNVSTNYELLHERGHLGHAGYVQIQAGF